MNEKEMRDFLAGVYENQRASDERLREVELIALSLRKALAERDPALEPIYARYYEAEQRSAGAQAHDDALRVIDKIIRGLRSY